MIYTVTCNPSLDYRVRLDAIEWGAVNRAAETQLRCGGKGVNVSIVLTRLGVENTALGFLAGFTGDAVERELRRLGVRTEMIRLQSGMTRINVKLCEKRETEINGTGPCPDEAAMAALLQRLSALGPQDVLVLSGSLPAGLPPDTYGTMLARSAGRGVRTVVDAAGKTLWEALRYRPFLVKPNRAELCELTGRALRTEEELADGARCLQKQGARNVLVSLAGDGALLLDEAGRAWACAAPRGVLRDSVGAGDSMVAGFLAEYRRSGDAAAALCMGVAAGSATAFSDGLAQRGQILALWEQRDAWRRAYSAALCEQAQNMTIL